MDQNREKFHCQFAGCNRSYLRSEHLNRHILIHKKGAFLCYLCQRRFTRNDLLNAHLRRHEKRGHGPGNFRKAPDTNSAPASVSPPSDTQPIQTSSPLDEPSPPAADWHSSLPPPFENPTQPSSSFHGDRNTSTNHLSTAITIPSQRNDTAHISQNESPNGNVQPHSSSATSALQHPLPNQQFLTDSTPYDDYTWLFHSASLFDLPSDDYLDLHFGDTLDYVSPSNLYVPPVESQRPQYEIPSLTAIDHERLIKDFPSLLSSPLGDPANMNHVLLLALDYCDIYLPLFHRPTLNISSCPSILLHTLCSLGAFLSSSPDIYEVGKMLHKYVWSLTVEKALLSSRVEMPFLQTMILIEHICTYSMTRQEHEIAEIVHSIIVTLARRNNLMTENYRKESGSRHSLEVKWKEWAQRESVIRIAHTIFVNDVQYMVYFSHHALLSVGMMKIPLPSHASLWDAPTAAEWEIQLRQQKKSNRARYYSLDAAIESIMSMKSSERKREFLQSFNNPTPLSLHILIHGIAAAIGETKYRSMGSSSTSITRELNMSHFDDALSFWRSCFEQLSESDQRCKLSWCALVMYYFSAILLRNSLSDIQMAAGSAFSSGRTVTPQSAQAAYTRLISIDPVSHDSYLHGLEVASLCLQEVDYGVSSHGNGKEYEVSSQPRPLWQTYGAFLGILVLWARALGLEKKEQTRSESTVGIRPFHSMSVSSTAATILTNMHHREQSHSVTATAEVKVLQSELRELIHTVCNHLTARPWEISHEAARILASLGER